MIPAERYTPKKGEAPPEGAMEWLWYVPDGQAPDTPKPDDADYHTFFKCTPCQVTFRAWKVRGRLMKCLWCGKFIREDIV
jgi:hypothetical protein